MAFQIFISINEYDISIMKKFYFLSLIVCLTSCSTIFNSGSQTVLAVPSSMGDEGVVVDITSSSGSYRTRMPATIVTSPSTFRDLSITVSDRCYEGYTSIVKKNVAPSYWANVLNGWGFIIDPLTGYMWKYDSQVMVPLSKKANCNK